jgi:hypothetical protein
MPHTDTQPRSGLNELPNGPIRTVELLYKSTFICAIGSSAFNVPIPVDSYRYYISQVAFTDMCILLCSVLGRTCKSFIIIVIFVAIIE